MAGDDQHRGPAAGAVRPGRDRSGDGTDATQANAESDDVRHQAEAAYREDEEDRHERLFASPAGRWSAHPRRRSPRTQLLPELPRPGTLPDESAGQDPAHESLGPFDHRHLEQDFPPCFERLRSPAPPSRAAINRGDLQDLLTTVCISTDKNAKFFAFGTAAQTGRRWPRSGARPRLTRLSAMNMAWWRAIGPIPPQGTHVRCRGPPWSTLLAVDSGSPARRFTSRAASGRSPTHPHRRVGTDPSPA